MSAIDNFKEGIKEFKSNYTIVDMRNVWIKYFEFDAQRNNVQSWWRVEVTIATLQTPTKVKIMRPRTHVGVCGAGIALDATAARPQGSFAHGSCQTGLASTKHGQAALPRTDGTRAGETVHVCQAFLSITLDEAHILNVSVEPSLQGNGLGSQMLDHLIDDARGKGARQMFLEVRESNPAAIQMYINQGFNEVGRRRHYYPTVTGREDALVFGLQLRFDQI